LQYGSGYDILLGNDFLKPFAKFIQTTYTICLSTKYEHTLKIPTLKYPYKVRTKRGRLGYEQIAFSALLKQIHSENPLQF